MRDEWGVIGGSSAVGHRRWHAAGKKIFTTLYKRLVERIVSFHMYKIYELSLVTLIGKGDTDINCISLSELSNWVHGDSLLLLIFCIVPIVIPCSFCHFFLYNCTCNMSSCCTFSCVWVY